MTPEPAGESSWEVDAPRPRPRARATPAVLGVVVVVAGALGVLWSLDDDQLDRQARVSLSAAALLAAVLVVGIASLRGRRARRWVWGSSLTAVVVFVALFEYRGMSGDLMPLFSPRWKSVSPTFSAGEGVRLDGLDDYPGFLGARRDAAVAGLQLETDWTARPPREIWRRSIGRGWSGFAVAGERAWTLEEAGGDERLVCYAVASGRPLWALSYEASYVSAIAGDGPRATPTVDAGRVFSMGATGVVTAADCETGERLWQHDVVSELGGVAPEWGASCSPLVHAGAVVVSAGAPGGLLVAYAADTGELLWKGGEGRASYSSPFVTELCGSSQIVSFNAASVTGHDPDSGSCLWSVPFSAKQVNVTQPLVLPGDRLLVSAGYGHGSRAFQLDRSEGGMWSIDEVWSSRRLKSKFSNWLLVDGYVYALDDGVFCCFDPEKGRRVWKEGRFGHGQMVLAGELVLLLAEHGELLAIDPGPDGLRVVARMPVLAGKSWNPPALAGRYLLVRNDTQARLWELPLR